MKKLTQDVFNGAPDWVKSAAIDADGWVWGYDKSKSELMQGLEEFFGSPRGVCHLGDEYDGSDWQNSAIDRV